MLIANIRDKMELFAAYMPFVKNGAIFIASGAGYQLGETVEVQLRLFDDNEAYNFTGTVIWITPKRAQGGRLAGVGVQFNEEIGKILRPKIEAQLGGLDQESRHTDTM